MYKIHLISVYKLPFNYVMLTLLVKMTYNKMFSTNSALHTLLFLFNETLQNFKALLSAHHDRLLLFGLF